VPTLEVECLEIFEAIEEVDGELTGDSWIELVLGKVLNTSNLDK
jgi:hypothetical protein